MKKSLKNKTEQIRIIKPPQRGGKFLVFSCKLLCFEEDILSISILFLLNI